MNRLQGSADRAVSNGMAALTLQDISADDLVNSRSMASLQVREQPAGLQHDLPAYVPAGNAPVTYDGPDARTVAQLSISEAITSILQTPVYTLPRGASVAMANRQEINRQEINREEITLYTGMASNSAWGVSDVNLYCWLVIRSRSIATGQDASAMRTNLRRTCTLTLPRSEKPLTWSRPYLQDGPSTLTRAHRRICVDDDGNVYALLICLRNLRTHTLRLKLKIVRRDLCRDDIEMVLLTAVASWTKMMRRAHAHSGWTGIYAQGRVLRDLGRRLGSLEDL
ncbi:hypothetical protein TPAR_01003 [Tolypocladium paradoxum]|uniref:Uncharacterized protein n=1 Tax=Tolypocladium paradoxum TaxID=94208 RepID=A0A2S4L8L1_9HYPO|nr:hypothetical protein TPAR_01003 [Tolypocladium paradoxum]